MVGVFSGKKRSQTDCHDKCSHHTGGCHDRHKTGIAVGIRENPSFFHFRRVLHHNFFGIFTDRRIFNLFGNTKFADLVELFCACRIQCSHFRCAETDVGRVIHLPCQTINGAVFSGIFLIFLRTLINSGRIPRYCLIGICRLH